MTELVTSGTTELLTWGTPALELSFHYGDDSPVRLVRVAAEGAASDVYGLPAVEIVTADVGHLPASGRLAHSEIGTRLRYDSHHATRTDAGEQLTIVQTAGDLRAELRLEIRDGAAAVRSVVTVANDGASPLVLRSATSWSAGFTDPAAEDVLGGWEVIHGASDWLGESRWQREPLRGPRFPQLAEHLTGHNPRGSFTATSTGTWSTGAAMPTAVVAHAARGFALAWQIEHNGAWRWEIGEDTLGGYIALAGPTDSDAAWTEVLAPGAGFTTVPATVAFGTSAEGAIAALTDYRRAARRPHPDNTDMPVVFNDYMNTLNGDPTTEKLLPLIDAAAEVGADVFCIDAGWYDDSGHWWDSVGEWLPSTTRFPGGLGEVIDAIRDAGMVPGLWLEPEVVGVRSPIADTLPADAFLQRHGVRLVEHHRYHLDLRHPAAVAHLDGVVDRLVEQFGVGFFKFDYNINPGPGTDLDTVSVGAGLLEHNRAHLAWLDGVLERHPELVIENCASGAMRMDFAMLSRLAMQSTSDQQDFVKYPPIAASAPIAMLPEQAASWAYPQPEMNDEELSFSLVTGLLGRYYVSGYLNRMTDAQRGIVATAIRTAKELRPAIAAGHAFWPAGLPSWTAPWVALGLHGQGDDILSLWRRGAERTLSLSLPHLRGRAVEVTTVFPTDLPEWSTDWDSSTGTLTVHAGDAPIAARTIRVAARQTRLA
ncbi:glycoside hydrolase family 36 protein [Microbacterium thalassium]|uniref:Alpha-galactosidase n=1 Tax=Microbacterium thalassium TaxID=362649 RepID=A0A7X0FN36_9MICO|nr:glycoside hydrolase family 36 protein [Microbacterium thalassium]MBB6390560.1 alpha-galactosidase [Microbacterium thalassium]GLK25671.1 hypothetical protein GCM10017607_29900 [Microbacterium thalassium]